MKKGIGIEDFREIIKEDCYYFDKTNYIEELIKDKTKIKLFTRPRRFGKTLNMSTLKYFFDIRNAEENKKLFKDLYIEKSEYFKEQGQYPTVFITMKDLKKNTWAECFFEMKVLLRELYEEFSFVQEKLSENEKVQYDKILSKAEDAEYGKSLKNLTNYLYRYYQKEVVVLIDEYDNPLIAANRKGYYKEAINFFRDFLSSTLKTNSYLTFTFFPLNAIPILYTLDIPFSFNPTSYFFSFICFNASSAFALNPFIVFDTLNSNIKAGLILFNGVSDVFTQ